MTLTLPDPSLTYPKGIFYNKAMTCQNLTPFSFTSEPSLMSFVIPYLHTFSTIYLFLTRAQSDDKEDGIPRGTQRSHSLVLV